MTSIPSTYTVKTITKGLQPASALVVGDQIYSVSDDLSTQRIATVTALSNVTDSCVKLQVPNYDITFPVDTFTNIISNGVSKVSVVTDITFWDLLKLHAPQDLGQGVAEPTSYDLGFALLYGTDTTGYDMESKFAFMAGMFDAAGYYKDDQLVLSNVQQEVTDKFADLCLELAGGYVLDTVRYFQSTRYQCETGRGKAAELLLAGMTPYLKTWNVADLDFMFDLFVSRCFKLNSVVDASCVEVETDVGGFIILGDGVIVK